MLSGRALRALAGERCSNPAKRTTETPCPTGAPLARRPESEPQGERPESKPRRRSRRAAPRL